MTDDTAINNLLHFGSSERDNEDNSGLSSNDEDCLALNMLAKGGKPMQKGYEFLYKKYKPKLKGYFLRGNITSDVSEDVIQTTFLKFFKSFDRFRKESAVSTYIFTIARNVLIDHFKKHPWTEPLDDKHESIEHITSFTALDKCVYLAFIEFKRDNFDCAQNLMLVVYNNLKGKDLAKLLGKSIGAVHEYLSQCRKKIAPYLQECTEHLGSA